MSQSHPNPALMLGRAALLHAMAQHWWLFVIRGVVAILFGLFVFLMPGPGLLTILALLAAWLGVDGVATIWQGVQGRIPGNGHWFWLDGIVSILAAAVILFAPGLSAFTLVFVAGVWSVVVGATRLVLAFRGGDVLLGALGALSIVIGVWLLLNPGPGLLALIWVVGIEAIVAGALMLALAFRLRSIAQRHPRPHG